MESADAEAWFDDRGWRLNTYREGTTFWADLESKRSSFKAPKYGGGDSAAEAIVSAKRRWDVEQEPPQPLPRRRP